MEKSKPTSISVEEARDIILDSINLTTPETISVYEASTRVCAEDIVSNVDVVPFNNAAMDGFAVRREVLTQASEDNKIVCNVIDEVPAGGYFTGDLSGNDVVRIMTGACVPGICDAVVKYEAVDYLGGNGRAGSQVAFTECPKSFDNIRRKGEEAKIGDTIISKGEKITPGGVGFIANCGINKVSVYSRPRVGIISIGTELQECGEKLRQGCIYESNSATISALVAEAGGIPKYLGIVKDDFENLCKTLKENAAGFDFLITTGGASNGDFDYIKQAIGELGDLKFTLVNMRPGKCQTFGLIDGTPVMGLPGNPSAAYCGFEMLIRPALLAMQGNTRLDRATLKAKLVGDRKKRDKRRMYLRGVLSVDNGEYLFTPANNQSSGIIGPVQQSNAFGILPEGDCGGKFSDGTIIDCIPFGVCEGAVI